MPYREPISFKDKPIQSPSAEQKSRRRHGMKVFSTAIKNNKIKSAALSKAVEGKKFSKYQQDTKGQNESQ